MRIAGLTLVLVLAATPAGAVTLWTGTTVVTATSPDCTSNADLNPPRVGQSYYTVFRPGGVGGNPATTFLALYEEDRAVFGMALGASVPFGKFVYEGIRLDGSRYGTLGNPGQGDLASFSYAPTTITSTTKTITWQAEVNNQFMGIDGCAVTLRSAVTR